MTTAAVRSSVPTSSRAAGWTAAGAQFGLALAYAGCAGAALAGHGSILAGMLLQMTPILAGLGLVVSGLLFLVGHTRGSRGLTIALLAATGVTLSMLVVSLTPAALDLTGRLLD